MQIARKKGCSTSIINKLDQRIALTGSIMPDHAQANGKDLHHQTRTVSSKYAISITEFLRRHKQHKVCKV